MTFSSEQWAGEVYRDDAPRSSRSRIHLRHLSFEFEDVASLVTGTSSWSRLIFKSAIHTSLSRFLFVPSVTLVQLERIRLYTRRTHRCCEVRSGSPMGGRSAWSSPLSLALESNCHEQSVDPVRSRGFQSAEVIAKFQASDDTPVNAVFISSPHPRLTLFATLFQFLTEFQCRQLQK